MPEDLDDSDQPLGTQPPPPNDWATALDVLRNELAAHGGVVSTRALRAALERAGIANPRPLSVRIKHFDFDAALDDNVTRPDFRWRAYARSIYTLDAYQRDVVREQDEAARVAEQAGAATEDDSDEAEEAIPPLSERRRNRQEESRMGVYVVRALENIYGSDHAPEDATCVFDVHNGRNGGGFENVDQIAVHWRSAKCVELVTVEAKLYFTPQLVQQARNYMRFSDRVWIAVPVPATAADAAASLRDYDPFLFEHVVEIGLGVLACRRRQGRAYEVFPVHWPRRMTPDPMERDRFIERYREKFELAGVLAPRVGRQYPSLR